MSTTALQAGLLACDTCGQANRRAPRLEISACARCGSTLHARKPDSIARAWALLIAT